MRVRRQHDAPPVRAVTERGPVGALLRSDAVRSANRARRRRAAERAAAKDPARFTAVETCCLFIGHMKSGTTLLGAMLDAHPEVICSDEVDLLRHAEQGYPRDALFHLVDRGARGEADKGRVTARRIDGGYDFAVASGSQGRSARPRVVGDGRAGPTTQALADDPALLDRFRALLGPVRLRAIHVIRNPFDPIALSVIRGKRALPDAIDHYFARCDALVAVRAMFAPGEVLPVRYEDVVADPRARLAEICAFLGVEPDAAYLDACAAIVRPEPERSRDRIDWPAEAVAEVERRAAAFDVLAGYRFAAQEVPA
jgi:hypothetical protein